jgi:hypothetical protein
MYVHIDPETLNRHPWIAVLIGLAGVILMLFLTNAYWKEYQALQKIACPAEITADTANLSTDEPRKWVTLISGKWHPEARVEGERKIPEKWIFGKVENTQIPVTDSKDQKLIVVKFEGKVDVQSKINLPVTGMLVYKGDKVWGGSISRQFSLKYTQPIMVLDAGAGKSQALNYFIMGLIFTIAFSSFTGYYLWVWSTRKNLLPNQRL